jgi:hypothetical protein
MISAVLGTLFVATQASATQSNLVMQCTGNHSTNTLVSVYEVIGSEGLAELNIIVRQSGNNDEDVASTRVFGAESISKNYIPLKKSAFGWAMRQSAKAIQNDQFYGFMFVVAPSYPTEKNQGEKPETLYLNLQRYEGSAPNLMVLNGQVEELSCRSSKI